MDNNTNPTEINEFQEKKSVGDVLSRPIKKKGIVSSERADYYHFESESIEAARSPSTSFDPSALEEKARDELNSFLLKRNIDPKRAACYQILIRKTRRKSSDGQSTNGEYAHSVHFVGPDNTMCTSKHDVYTAIIQSEKHTKNLQEHTSSRSGSSTVSSNLGRETVHMTASKNLSEAKSKLPLTINEITVHRFGRLDKDSRSAFHAQNRLYPVGYKCTIAIPTQLSKNAVVVSSKSKNLEDGEASEAGAGTEAVQEVEEGEEAESPTKASAISTTNGQTERFFMCEIREAFGRPEFIVTDTQTNVSHTGTNEADVWRKFKIRRTSIFNPAIELLLEGLDGVLACRRYKFVWERPPEEYVPTKQEEQEAKRRKLIQEKEKREKDREEERRKREKEKEMEKLTKAKQKIDDKMLQLNRKEINAELKKVRADAGLNVLRMFDAEEEVCIESIPSGSPVSTIFTSQASNACTFGAAQNESTESSANPIASSEANTRDFEVFLDSLPNCSDDPKLPLSGQDWDTLFDVVNFLHLFNTGIILESDVILERFIQDLVQLSPQDKSSSTSVGYSSSSSTCPSSQEVVSSQTESLALSNTKNDPTPSGMDVEGEPFLRFDADESVSATSYMETVGSVTEQKLESADLGAPVLERSTSSEAEWDENYDVDCAPKSDACDEGAAGSSSTGSAYSSGVDQRAASQARLENIQLSLVQVILGESDLSPSVLLDVTDKLKDESAEKEGANAKPSKKVKNLNKFPLNNLTWQELARMCIVAKLIDDEAQTKEENVHALRGSKVPPYRITRNVIRHIRYRFAYRLEAEARTKLKPLGTQPDSSTVSHIVYYIIFPQN